jgi:tape measure domain-containing protein
MADVSKTVAIIFQGQDNASGVAGKLADNLKTVGDAGGSASGKVDDLAKSTERLADKEGSIVSLSNAMTALAASLVFKAFVDANVELEKFERAMTLLKGSTEAAGEEFDYISRIARTLGLDLFSAADAYTQLTAATKGTALEGDQTRVIFEAVSTAMSSLNKSSADTQGALLAISQIVSKGNVSLEELRGQLGERLPGAFGIAAKSMGLTTAELDKLVSSGNLTAEEFLPKFARALQDTFGEVKFVDGYAAAMNRLQQAVSEAFIEIGKSGAFDALTKGVELGTAAVVGIVAYLRLLGEVYGTVAGAIATGNFSGFGEAISESIAKAAETTRGARDALLGYRDETEKVGTVVDKTAESVDDLAKKTAANAAAQKEAEEATKKASESSKAAAKALADQAKEAQRAEEAAAKMALELEKLASNERIKSLEFRAEINVAQIQADAQKVVAAFDSINNTVTSTGDVIGDLFGLFKDIGSLDSSARNALFQQLDVENKRRQEALDLQKQLTEAQVANLKAQTRQLDSGGALIKIDGAGLQPHLEAFMWEILKTIQTRVNRDGLKLLLGV